MPTTARIVVFASRTLPACLVRDIANGRARTYQDGARFDEAARNATTLNAHFSRPTQVRNAQHSHRIKSSMNWQDYGGVKHERHLFYQTPTALPPYMVMKSFSPRAPTFSKPPSAIEGRISARRAQYGRVHAMANAHCSTTKPCRPMRHMQMHDAVAGRTW